MLADQGARDMSHLRARVRVKRAAALCFVSNLFIDIFIYVIHERKKNGKKISFGGTLYRPDGF